MYLKCVLLFVLAHLTDFSNSFILNQNVNSLSECENICSASGSRGEYDQKTKLCECISSKKLDDVDLGVFAKNAQIISPEVKPESVQIIKRETPDENHIEVVSSTETLTSENLNLPEEIVTTEESELNPEGIVGQAHIPASPTNRRPQASRVRPLQVRTRQRQARVMSLEQQRIILQQINDHGVRLSQSSDSRIRDLEIEAMRRNLDQLSHTTLAQPQIRARIGEERVRPLRQRLHSRIVGSAHVENEKEKSEEKNFEIVTQDPSLIDE